MGKHFRPVLLLFLVVTLWGHSAFGLAFVVAPKVRDDLINTARSHMDGTSEDILERIDAAYNPFVPYVEEQAPVAVAAAPEAAVRLPDAVVVRAIARQFRPKGVLQKGNEFVLMLDRGRLQRGMAINARLRGEDYRVVVERITNSDFTLRLNSATATAPIKPEETKGTISFDNR